MALSHFLKKLQLIIDQHNGKFQIDKLWVACTTKFEDRNR